jgi:hypothetical protein
MRILTRCGRAPLKNKREEGGLSLAINRQLLSELPERIVRFRSNQESKWQEQLSLEIQKSLILPPLTVPLMATMIACSRKANVMEQCQ